MLVASKFMKKAGTKAAHSLGSVSALCVPQGSILLRRAFLTSLQNENKKKGSMRISVARCQRRSAGCPWHHWLDALGSRQKLFGCLFLRGPAWDGLCPGFRGAEHLQLYLTSTGGAVGLAGDVPVQDLEDATHVLHPLRAASATTFLQPLTSSCCADPQLWGLLVISINVGIQLWGFLP